MRCTIRNNGNIVLEFEDGAEMAMIDLAFAKGPEGELTFTRTAGNTFTAKPSIVSLASLPKGMNQPLGLTSGVYQQIIDLLRNREKLAAIKLLKEVSNMGLKESKDWIDSLTEKINQ